MRLGPLMHASAQGDEDGSCPDIRQEPHRVDDPADGGAVRRQRPGSCCLCVWVAVASPEDARRRRRVVRVPELRAHATTPRCGAGWCWPAANDVRGRPVGSLWPLPGAAPGQGTPCDPPLAPHSAPEDTISSMSSQLLLYSGALTRQCAAHELLRGAASAVLPLVALQQQQLAASASGSAIRCAGARRAILPTSAAAAAEQGPVVREEGDCRARSGDQCSASGRSRQWSVSGGHPPFALLGHQHQQRRTLFGLSSAPPESKKFSQRRLVG